MHPARPVQQSLACVLLFQVGALYAFGVFDAPISTAHHSLAGVWAAAISIMAFVAVPAMFAAGVFLARPEHKTHRIRLVVDLSSVSLATLAIAAPAVANPAPLVLNVVVGTQGIAYGILYVVGVELLAAWSPSRPGLAVGAGQMVFGFGSIVYTAVFSSLLDAFSSSTALLLSAVLLAVPTAVASRFLCWPDQTLQDHPTSEPEQCEDECEGLLLHWTQLPHLVPFWSYVTAVFALQAGFGFIPYFFSIGLTFQQSRHQVVRYFDIILLFTALLRPFVGMLIDVLKVGRGAFAIGSKNMMVILLILQLIFFVALVPISTAQNFVLFLVFTGVIVAIFAAGACAAAIAARELFGPQNSSLVFGVGASISMGLGEFFFGRVLAIVDQSHRFGITPAKYTPFYLIGIIWSGLGILLSLMMRKYNSIRVVEAELRDTCPEWSLKQSEISVRSHVSYRACDTPD